MFKSVVCYLDDILKFSNTTEEHMNMIGKVLERLRKVGLQLNIKKCSFMKKKVIFLGHRISAEEIGTDIVKDLRIFLGFFTYYRKFVKDNAIMTEPLNTLMRTSRSKWTSRGRQNSSKNRTDV